MSEEETTRFPLRRPLKSPIPLSFKGGITNLLKFGHIQELLDFWVEERSRIGLEATPPTAYKDEKALNEVQVIAKQTKLDRKIGFDWERKEPKV
jgi:heterodisulfide reductase subunit C